MDANTTHVMEASHVPSFNPAEHTESAQRLGLVSNVNLDPAVWEAAKPMVAPMAWAWYDSHKDQKVAKLGGFYQITIGSFGIAEMLLTAIFGSRPSV
jgi:hypothetical protein